MESEYKTIQNQMFFPNQNIQVKNSNFDPYDIMLKNRNKELDTNEIPTVNKYLENEVAEIEEFCKKNGIIGFNIGKMSPSYALKLLKSKMGYKTESTQTNKKTILYG